MGTEIWGRQLTTRGLKLGSQKGVLLAAQNEPKSRVFRWYISTPAWRSDLPFHLLFTQSLTGPHMFLALKDLHLPRRGDDPNVVHECQNGKFGRLGRLSWVGNLGYLVVQSLDSRPSISLLVPCPGIWLGCHTGCLLFTEGMDTWMGQKTACGAKVGIMDRTKS